MSNNKKGFIYYSVETNRYEDKRIKKLKKDMGCAGLCVYDKILCEIYRVEGCFLQWDEDTVFDVAEYFGLKESLVNEIVAYCCHVGLFKKELYDSEKVLTSQSIQSRFIEWSKKAKRVDINIPEKYKILPEEYTQTSGRKRQTSGSLTQRKVKESKEKESKEVFHPPDLSESNLFRKPVIPTKQEVLECFIQHGGTKEMAKSFWDKCETTGWYYDGSPIVNFRNRVGSYIRIWNKNNSGKKEINNQDAAEGQRIQEEKSRQILGG